MENKLLVGEEVVPVLLNYQDVTEWCGNFWPFDEESEFSQAPAPIQPALLGSLGWLIEQYQTHKASSYHKLQFHVRKNHDGSLRRLKDQYGAILLSEIRASTIQIWHNGWSEGGKVAMAHTFIGQLRTMFGFGLLMLEDRECERLCVTMSKLKFSQPEPRSESLTADQAVAVRAKAHWRGWGSIALAQALQFELILRQKDVIGEWVPVSEPGISDVVSKDKGKWFKGLRWEEIDQNMILTHTTSKRQKPIQVDLTLAPMVMEELALHTSTPIARLTRASLPASGPIIICEITGFPYSAAEYRRKWRLLANLAGVPKSVRNMDSRSGGITESFKAGVRPDAIQLTATHSDLAMTQRYNRQNHLETRSVAQVKRLELRNSRQAAGE